MDDTILEQAKTRQFEKIENDVKTLNEGIKSLAHQSKHFQAQISGAKTNTKKQYFHKKLVKNNKDLYRALLALEIYRKKLEKKDAPIHFDTSGAVLAENPM